MIKKLFLTISLLVSVSICAFAGPEATYNKLHITYEWLSNGDVDMNFSKVLTYNTHSSFNDLFGETFVMYNPQYQTVTVNESYTVQKDGTKIVTPENAFNEVLPRSAANAPDHNYLRELVITHTGLELGATVYLDYTIHTKAGYWQALDIDVPFYERAFIDDACLNVIVPTGTPVNDFVSGQAVTSKSTANGKDTYTYAYKNLTANPGEALSAPYNDAIARVVLNTYPADFNPFDIIYKAEPEGRPGAPRMGMGLGMDMMYILRTLRTKEDVVNYVNSQIATCPLTLQETGYRMRTMAEIMASCYATNAEKAMLTSSLLRMTRQESALYPVYPTSALRQVGDKLALASLTGISTEAQKEPATLVVDEKTNIALTHKDAIYALYSLPTPKGGVATFRLGTLNTQRLTPMELPRKVDETHTYVVTCEDGVKLDAPDREKHVSNAIGSVDITFKWSGTSLIITRALKINETYITPAQYPDLRALINTWNTASWQSIIVK